MMRGFKFSSQSGTWQWKPRREVKPRERGEKGRQDPAKRGPQLLNLWMAGLSRHQPPGCWESNPLRMRVSVLGSRSHMPLLKKSLVWAWLMPATSHLPLLPASSETIVCLSPSAPQRGVFSDPRQPIPLNLSVYWATTRWQFLFVLHCIYPNSRYILTGVCICLILVFPL